MLDLFLSSGVGTGLGTIVTLCTVKDLSLIHISTFSDGFKVPMMIMSLFKDYKPLALFSWVALLFVVLGLVAGVPVIAQFAATGLVPKLPTALLAVGLVFVGLLLSLIHIYDHEDLQTHVAALAIALGNALGPLLELLVGGAEEAVVARCRAVLAGIGGIGTVSYTHL